MTHIRSLYLLLFSLLIAAPASGSDTLVRNGLLQQGTGTIAAHWTSSGYAKSSTATRFSWTQSDAGLGQIGIQNVQANDARWTQKVSVSPNTWYRISGWARTKDVGSGKMGAYLSVMGTFHNTRDLRGTQSWHLLSMWVKTGSLDTHLELAARLGGYSSENTGSAFFTAIAVEEAGYPAAGTPHVFGGEAGQKPTNTPIWVEVLGLLLVAGMGLIVWRYVATPENRQPR